MNPLFIAAIAIIAIAGLYLLLTKKTRPGPANLRDDSTERPELRGDTQAKNRQPR
jgi:hypothetical protein